MLERFLNRSARILDSILVIIAFVAGAVGVFAGLSDLRKGFVIGVCLVSLFLVIYRAYVFIRPELSPHQVRRIVREYIRTETKNLQLKFLDITKYELKDKKWYVSGVFSITSTASHPFELVIDCRTGKPIKWEKRTHVKGID